jgi:hypothetical protein
MTRAHRGGRVRAQVRCTARHDLGLPARRALKGYRGARLPPCADGSSRGGNAEEAIDHRAGEAGPPARALGSRGIWRRAARRRGPATEEEAPCSLRACFSHGLRDRARALGRLSGPPSRADAGAGASPLTRRPREVSLWGVTTWRSTRWICRGRGPLPRARHPPPSPVSTVSRGHTPRCVACSTPSSKPMRHSA